MEKDAIRIALEEMLEDQQEQAKVNAQMIAILQTIAANTEAIKQQKRSVDFIIKYKYYSKWIIYLAAFFLLFSLLLTGLYCNKIKQVKQYQKSDLILNYLKLRSTPNMKKFIAFTDSLYLAHPDSLKYAVQRAEKALKDSMLRADEKKNSPASYTNPVKPQKNLIK